MSISYINRFGMTGYNPANSVIYGNNIYCIEGYPSSPSVPDYYHTMYLSKYDITNPEVPIFTNSVELDTMACSSIVIYNNYIYTCDKLGTDGIAIYDLSLTRVGTITYPNILSYWSLSVINNYLYVSVVKASSYLNILVFDVSNPLAPVYVNLFQTSPSDTIVVTRIKTQGNYLYSISVARFSINDISDPYNEINVWSVSTNGYNIEINGNYAYIHSGNSIDIYDISNPYSTFFVSSILDGNIAPWGSIVVDGYNSVLGYSSTTRFKLYNISTPTAPIYLESSQNILTGGYGEIQLYGDYYFVPCGGQSSSCQAMIVFEYNPLLSDSSESESFLSDSSSSSSFEPETKELNSVLIEQGHYNLLPFYFIAQQGFTADTSTINFNIKTSHNQYFDYQAILDVVNTSNSSILTTDTSDIETYTPQDDSSKYKHDAITYVDIISNDSRGVKKINVRNEENKYEDSDPSYSYVIPKFAWDNTLFKSNVSSNSVTSTYTSSVWVGANNKNIYRVGYDSNSASITYVANTYSEAYNIVFQGNNYLYCTDYDYLSRFLINTYLGEDKTTVLEAEQDVSISNTLNDVISYYDKTYNKLYCVEAYYGKLIVRDPDTFAVLESYEGLDAPFKVVKAEIINTFFIAGSNILWKMVGTTISEVYKVGGYRIKDISCSEDGMVCLLLDGTGKDIVRILDNNLFKIKFDQNITKGSATFCDYCGQGIFYVLEELNTVAENEYIANHYIFDVKAKTVIAIPSENSIVTTTTTTTSKATSSKIDIETPNGGETIQLGSVYEIKWGSSESIKDVVKIELYKDEILYDVIANETQNTGIYQWDVLETIGKGSTYKIKITRLTASDSTDNSDISDAVFSLAEEVTTTTTTTKPMSNIAIGIDYDNVSNRVAVMLRGGLMGYFDLDKKEFNGMFDTGLDGAICVVAHNDLIKEFSDVTKARVFVGTEPYLNNKWDSGIIETDLSSIYYGGGNNLTPGETYIVNISVCSKKYGWSDVQSKSWIMPR